MKDEKQEIFRKEIHLRKEFGFKFELENASPSTLRKFGSFQFALFSFIMVCMTLNIMYGPGSGYSSELASLVPCLSSMLLSSIGAHLSIKKSNQFGRLCTLILAAIAGFYAGVTFFYIATRMTGFRREERSLHFYSRSKEEDEDEITQYKLLVERIVTNVANSLIVMATILETTVVSALTLTLFRFHFFQVKSEPQSDFSSTFDHSDDKAKENMTILDIKTQGSKDMPPNYEATEA